MGDPQVPALAAARGRLIVTHDVRTMPGHFLAFVADQPSTGLILVPKMMAIGIAIEELLLIRAVSGAEEWIDQMRRLPL